MPLPLERFRVIDLTRVRSGPTCVRQLADWGAQVIKVEQVGPDAELGGPRDASDFQNLHRNKRSLTLDLKQPAGREVLFQLVDRADVLVENFRPDVKGRLGIDYAAAALGVERGVVGARRVTVVASCTIGAARGTHLDAEGRAVAVTQLPASAARLVPPELGVSDLTAYEIERRQQHRGRRESTSRGS